MEEPVFDDDVRAVRLLFPGVLADGDAPGQAARTVARVMRGILPAGLAPDDLIEVLRHALLDPAARVRARARALIPVHGVAIDVRAMYVERLTRTVPHELAVAIEGVGDIGTAADLANGSCRSYVQAREEWR